MNRAPAPLPRLMQARHCRAYHVGSAETCSSPAIMARLICRHQSWIQRCRRLEVPSWKPEKQLP